MPIYPWVKKHSFSLVCWSVLLLAATIRLYRVAEVPVGINWDEAAHSYNAWSIWQTGKDEWGNRWPLFLRSFDDYKSAAMAYALLPVVALSGLSASAIRSWAAIMGTLGIAGSSGLILRLSKSKTLALISLGILAVMPWDIHYSRAVMEQGLSLTLLVWGFWAWFGKTSKEKWLGTILLVAAMYSYHSIRLITPLLFIAVNLVQDGTVKKKIRQNIWRYVAFGLAAIWLWWQAIFGLAGQRARDLLILDSPQIGLAVQEGYYRSSIIWGRPLRIFNNKFLVILPDILERYLVHFSPDFLFFGNNPDSRHATSQNLLLITLPFLLLGLTATIRKNSATDRIFFIWLAVSPLAAMLTKDVPHSGRVFPMVIPLAYFAARGIEWLVSYFRGRVKIIAIAIVFGMWLANSAWYLHTYWQNVPEQTVIDWQGHLRSPTLYAAEHQNQYNHVVFADSYNNHYLFVAWYLRIDPREVQDYRRHWREKNVLAGIDLRTVSDERLSCLLLEPKTLIITEKRITWPIPAAAEFFIPDRFHESPAPYVAYDGTLLNDNQRGDLSSKCEAWRQSESSAPAQMKWPFQP